MDGAQCIRRSLLQRQWNGDAPRGAPPRPDGPIAQEVQRLHLRQLALPEGERPLLDSSKFAVLPRDEVAVRARGGCELEALAGEQPAVCFSEIVEDEVERRGIADDV